MKIEGGEKGIMFANPGISKLLHGGLAAYKEEYRAILLVLNNSFATIGECMI